MPRRPLKERKTLLRRDYRELPILSDGYARLFGAYLRITTSFATNQRHNQCFNRIATQSTHHMTRFVRLACLIHAASIHPELGSNSNVKPDTDNKTCIAVLERNKRKNTFVPDPAHIIFSELTELALCISIVKKRYNPLPIRQ